MLGVNSKQMPNPMDFHEIMAFALYGADWLLFVQSITTAYFVFPSKKKPFYILLNIGLCSSMIFSTMQILVLYFNIPYIYHVIIGNIGWYLMIFTAALIYVKRIESLGGYHSHGRLIHRIPYYFLFIMIPVNIISILALYTNGALNDIFKSISFITGILFSILIASGEIYLYLVLLQRIKDILEYRTKARRKLTNELSASMLCLVAFDILLIVSKFALSNLDRHLRGFSYVLRFYFVIRFFDDLLDDCNRERHDSAYRPLDHMEMDEV
eukprot:NODE_810_length_3750_cov_0.623939.p1 type:complete len:268 gc:universal NODE_810_length_3750_cov_0.623939:2807-2004(-)